MNESNDGIGYGHERASGRGRTRTGVLILAMTPVVATSFYTFYSVLETITQSELVSSWFDAVANSLAFAVLVAGLVGACWLPLSGLARVVAAGLAAIIEPQLAYAGFYFVDFYLMRHLISLAG